MCEKNNNVDEELTMANIDNDKLYNTAQVAKLLGMSTRTINKYIRDGQLVTYFFGKLYKIKGKDLLAFINSKKNKSIA